MADCPGVDPPPACAHERHRPLSRGSIRGAHPAGVGESAGGRHRPARRCGAGNVGTHRAAAPAARQVGGQPPRAARQRLARSPYPSGVNAGLSRNIAAEARHDPPGGRASLPRGRSEAQRAPGQADPGSLPALQARGTRDQAAARGLPDSGARPGRGCRSSSSRQASAACGWRPGSPVSRSRRSRISG